MDSKNLSQYFKSIIDQDRCAVVICNLAHEIIYMNPTAAARYAKRGGAALVGQSLLNCHNAHSGERLKRWRRGLRRAQTTISSIPSAMKRKIRTSIWSLCGMRTGR